MTSSELLKTFDFITNNRLSKVNVSKTASNDYQIHLLPNFSASQLKLIVDLSSSDKEAIKKLNSPLYSFQSGKVKYFLVDVETLVKNLETEYLIDPPYSRVSDLVGQISTRIKPDQGLSLQFYGKAQDACVPAFVGILLAQYSFKGALKKATEGNIEVAGLTPKFLKAALEKARAFAGATNIARHLVNLPPNWLHPVSYSKLIEGLFKNSKSVQVEVWDEKRLKKENMNLHLAVGKVGETAPRLVKIGIGPKTAKKRYAVIGKGITFDSGGLDLKPSQAMRLMKKDMGGSAAVVGQAYALSLLKPKCRVECYLALDENGVSEGAFRPGDIIQARNGLTVEIHNTDAEGRLVMADALTLATEGSKKPDAVFDAATLTGAIKVGLGAEVGGLFSNKKSLQNQFLKAAEDVGELFWPMPLVGKERHRLNSPVADLVNSTDGFGGAITAALFLENFINKTPWVHLDIYAWNDRASGALNESGGSGQAARALAQFFINQ